MKVSNLSCEGSKVSSMNLVCIGTSKRGVSSSKEEEELGHQISYPLITPTTNASSSKLLQNNIDVVEVPIISTTALALEEFICSRLATHEDCNVHTNNSNSDTNNCLGGNNIIDEEEGYNPVQIFVSDDAHLLHCRPLLSNDDGEEPTSTIFGISERVIGHDDESNVSIAVDLNVCEPNFKTINSRSSCSSNHHDKQMTMHLFKDGCCCHHPKGDWARQDFASKARHTNNGSNVHSSSENVNVTIVDLTKMQNLRRRTNIQSDSDETYPCFDTPGRVFHLLRSLLNCNGSIHCASPWSQLYGENHKTCTGQVVALLVKDPSNKQYNSEVEKGNAVEQFWNDIEEKEINELLNFRTGDAAPSYYLHSSSQLFVENGDILDDITRKLNNDATTATVVDTVDMTDDGCSLSKETLLLVYRHLPPRDVLSKRQSSGQDEKYVGCLLETYLEEDIQEEKSELDIGVESKTLPLPVVKNRIVSPPYISHSQEFPGLLDSLLKGIQVLQEEAQTIPQWTAWPEQNHYADNCWNVFPLCYTFPATDLSQRKFIHKTCSFVPETTKLLQTLGPHLRTALFSRLDPRARLGAHTGWSDLANHVIRVHIPLIVPGGKCSSGNITSNNNNTTLNQNANDNDVIVNCTNGLCGTWVDGCVETHEEGRVICFDDSKVHRAFNYSNEERVVLIIDLARPEGLPQGTATGGHSDELDDFINAF